MTTENQAMSIPVEPTSPQTKDSQQYTDIALTSLFNAHISIINSERHVIWLRYQAMLLANSIVLGFLTRTPPPGSGPTRIGSIFGLLLCGAWFILTRSGFRLFLKWHDASRAFKWEKLGSKFANPSEVGQLYSVKAGDWICRMAYGVIWLFAGGYFVMLIAYG